MPYTHGVEPDPPAIPKAGAPSEPLVTVGSLGAAAAAVIALIVAFGPDLTQGQTAAILGATAVAAPFIVAIVGRLRAWSPASARRLALAEREKAQNPGGMGGLS